MGNISDEDFLRLVKEWKLMVETATSSLIVSQIGKFYMEVNAPLVEQELSDCVKGVIHLMSRITCRTSTLLRAYYTIKSFDTILNQSTNVPHLLRDVFCP